MTTKKPDIATGGVNSTEERLQVVEADFQSREQSRARCEHDLKLQQEERATLKTAIAAAETVIQDAESKIALNDQIIARAPSLVEAMRKHRKIDVAVDELKKEMAFVERQAQDIQNKWNATQSDRAAKEDMVRNKKMNLEQMNPDQNRGAFQSAQAEIRMLENGLTRGAVGFDRSQEDSKRFEARVYDMQMNMKQLIKDQREAEQDETTSRRLEMFETENQRLKMTANIKRSEVSKATEDLKKVERSVTKLEERLKREEIEVSALTREINQLKSEK